MAIPAYLQDKQRNSKKRSPGRFLFNIIFLLSLGLNIYLLNSSQNPGLNALAENLKIEAVEPEATENIETTDPAKSPGQATPVQATSETMKLDSSPEKINHKISPQQQITPVSYVVPQTGGWRRGGPDVAYRQAEYRELLTEPEP